MATSRRINRSSHAQKSYGGMGIATIILSLVLSLAFLASMIARPVIQLSNGRVLYLDGIIASAVLLGAMMWALVEVLTPPGKGIALIWRAGIGMIVGGAIGAYVGYSFHFSQYVILPIYQHNNYALFYFFTILIFGLAVIWSAAWDHRHGFLGQLGKHMHKSNYKESGRHKGWRTAVALLIAILFVFLMVPASSAVGTAFTSLDDHKEVPLLLQNMSSQNASSAISNCCVPVRGMSIGGVQMPYSYMGTPDEANVACHEQFMPTYIHKNTTGANVTHYATTALMEYNLTVGEAANFTLHSIYIIFGARMNVTLTFGVGNWTDFSPIAVYDMNNSVNISMVAEEDGGAVMISPDVYSVPVKEALKLPEYEAFRIAIPPSMLLGNQSRDLSVKIHELGNKTAEEMKIYTFDVGVQGPTLIGPIQVDQIGYIIGAIMTIIASFLVMPWYDLGEQTGSTPRTTHRRKAGSRRRR